MNEPRIATRHITAAFRETTLDDRVAGQSWYATARQLAATLDPADPKRGAAVIAVLSPQTSWPRNVKLATDAYAGRKLGCLPANAAKARRILAGEDPEDVVRGDKVRSFYRCIADPTDPRAVAIDRHAVAIAVGRVLSDAERGKLLGRKGGYDAVVDAYRRAARIVSRETGVHWSPADLQAATWCYWRRERAEANHG